MPDRSAKWLVSALAAAHLAVTLWHSGAHTELAIGLPPLKLAYAYAVIVIAPPLAAVLVWTRFSAFGLWLFTLAMVGSLVFAAYHHYVLVSPDNIAHLPDGSAEAQARFVSSAGWSAVLELAGSLCGAWALGRASRVAA
ncbi:MAG TPA: hypothetical protein VMR31_03690 [Myxococcota bacterium]|nr:hypothetical protein [Myxococcota bacterium]